jgi:omega-6 fatty acid desaturase (delta-12 desaturase)
MRTGAELVQASNAFTQEYPATTWRLLLTTLLAFGLSLTGALLVPMSGWYLLPKAIFSVLAGLVIVRLFIFYHDYLHGAILRNSKIGAILMRGFGWWVMAGASVWKQTHDYHHKNNGKMLGASIGSYPIVTVELWKNMSQEQKRDYQLARHPLTILFGYFTVFMLGMCISPFRRNREQHKDGPIALVTHLVWLAVLGLGFGWSGVLFGGILPHMVASAAGSYLFYAQHNFPGMQLRNRQDWDYSFSALKSSSMFEMGPVMHWFTGNIGYHHVHHLNHRIPFYRLPEAMKGMPELQSPGKTSWKFKDVLGCLKGKVWDPGQGRMVSYAEADAAAEAPVAK